VEVLSCPPGGRCVKVNDLQRHAEIDLAAQTTVTRPGGHLGLEAVSLGAATASKERKCTSGHNPPASSTNVAVGSGA
jgi:hypothetical protein